MVQDVELEIVGEQEGAGGVRGIAGEGERIGSD